MTTADTPDITDRDLGRLEGRVEEQGARLNQLHADLTSGFQQVNASLTLINARIDQLNSRIDRLLLAILGIGGGLLAAAIGIIITLLLRGAS